MSLNNLLTVPLGLLNIMGIKYQHSFLVFVYFRYVHMRV